MIWRNLTSGIRTLWYGMNIPNSSNMNRRLAPGNFHLASTYPFIDPRKAERRVAGTARNTLLRKLGASWLKARLYESRVGALESSQSVDCEASANDFSEATTMAKTGSR